MKKRGHVLGPEKFEGVGGWENDGEMNWDVKDWDLGYSMMMEKEVRKEDVNSNSEQDNKAEWKTG